MSFGIVRRGFISKLLRRLLPLYIMSDSELIFARPRFRKLVPPKITTGHQIPHQRSRGEGLDRRYIYLCDGNDASFYLRHAEERGATSLLISNKNTDMHQAGAGGHLSSRRGRKDSTDRHQDQDDN